MPRFMLPIRITLTASISAMLLPGLAMADGLRLTVPNDYPTIQAAVDAAQPDTKILVRAGTYTEAVEINTPDLEIVASGIVNLNGGFRLESDADDVTISGFRITPDASVFAGIFALGVTGGKAENNVVTDGPNFDFGIYYENSTGCRIKGNRITGTTLGIYLRNSSGNAIDANTVTGVAGAAGIGLEEDSDNNMITNNVITNSNGGMFTNAFAGATLEGNVIRSNTFNDNYATGIDLIHANNSSVSDNTVTNNTGPFTRGILVRSSSNNNTIKRNRATGNEACDIDNEPGNTGNVFWKNIAGCTSGF